MNIYFLCAKFLHFHIFDIENMLTISYNYILKKWDVRALSSSMTKICNENMSVGCEKVKKLKNRKMKIWS